MRTVFDTNVLVSALLFEHSIPGQAFFRALEEGEILISITLVNEINRVLIRRKFERYITPEQREEFLIALVQSATLVDVTETISACRDPKDNHILELAVNGKAEVIVTGDADLLALHPFRSIAVLNPQDFVKASPRSK